MGRKAAVFWHATFSVVAGVLYFFFVLPRWPELMGDTTHTLGTVLRIVAGVLIALAALPVVFTLLRARKPEYGTPRLALTLQTSSVVAHVLAGALIAGTAISEIWLNLDTVGQWLFGVYGAAAAIALLGVFGFYLSFVAELPPPPPKPLKPKKEKKQRRRGRNKDTTADDTEAAGDETAETSEETEQPAEVTAEADVDATAEEPESTVEEAPAPEDTELNDVDSEADQDTADSAASGLRNRRPTGKSSGVHRRRRTRRGVAVED